MGRRTGKGNRGMGQQIIPLLHSAREYKTLNLSATSSYRQKSWPGLDKQGAESQGPLHPRPDAMLVSRYTTNFSVPFRKNANPLLFFICLFLNQGLVGLELNYVDHVEPTEIHLLLLSEYWN